jgi:YVTN family beta-propeller protein
MRLRILLRTWVILTSILVCDAQLQSPPYYVYVTNEASGDMSIINPLSNRVVATVPLGKRPRGIHASPDRRTIYLTLSG